MERLILFTEPNLSQGADPSLPSSNPFFATKPFYWNVRQDDASGDIVASLMHNRRSFTGSISIMESSQALFVTKTRHVNNWQLRPGSPENAAPLMTAKHPKWWRRMIEFEVDGQLFVMSTKRRLGYDFEVHRATSNLNASNKNRRQREKEGELVGEVSVESMRRFKLKVSFNENLGLLLPLFCTWLVYAMGISSEIHTMYSEDQGRMHAVGPRDNTVWGGSHDSCLDDHGFDHGFDGGSSGFGDSSSCGMDSGGGSNFD